MSKQKFARWALAAALTTAALPVLAQQDDIPILRPKSQTTKLAISTLLVTCDLACTWKLDGEAKGRVDAGASVKVKVELGQHIVSAATEDGIDKLENEIEIMPPGQTIVHIALQPVRDARLYVEQQAKGKADQEARDKAAREQAAREAQEKATRDQQETERMLRELAIPTWTDQATGLTWTKKENGTDVTWQQATEYCRNLKLAGYNDWRLPTINELGGIYDKKAEFDEHNVKGNLQLSKSPFWSRSLPDFLGKGSLTFNFWYGGRQSPGFHEEGTRALCVRRNAQDARELAIVTWTDPATGLMWTKEDNGSDMNWQQAMDYCRNLQLAGPGWRLPSIKELQSINGAYDYFKERHVKGNLELSGWWHWSSTKQNASWKAWKFDSPPFSKGQVLHDGSDSKGGRALCVRRPGE